MLRIFIYLMICCLCACTLEKDQIPETVVSYAVSSTSGQAELFTVSYRTPDGSTVTLGELNTDAWSSPTWEDKFSRGDLVEIRVTSKNAGTPIKASVFFNFYLLESERMENNATELIIQTSLPF